MILETKSMVYMVFQCYHRAELWPPGGILVTWKKTGFCPSIRFLRWQTKSKYLLPILTIANRSMSEEPARSSSTIACLKVRLESAHRPPDVQKVKVRVRNNQPAGRWKEYANHTMYNVLSLHHSVLGNGGIMFKHLVDREAIVSRSCWLTLKET